MKKFKCTTVKAKRRKYTASKPHINSEVERNRVRKIFKCLRITTNNKLTKMSNKHWIKNKAEVSHSRNQNN